MSDVEPLEDTTPLAHVTIAYLGPVAPHWEIRGHFGDTKMIDDFWARVTARLLLLPRHDPQFRRNKERVNRDAERERITLDWDLGDEEPARASAPRSTRAAPAPVAEAAPVEPAPVEPAPAEPAPAEPAPDAPPAENAVPVEAVALDEASSETVDDSVPAESAVPVETESAPAETEPSDG